MKKLRPHSIIYALFLVEKWLQFQMKSLKDKLPHDINTLKELANSVQQGTKAEEYMFNEFYLHNLVTPHPYKWSPNPYPRYVQQRALSSWNMHENKRINEMIKYEVASYESELYFRGESFRPSKVTFSHATLTMDKYQIPILVNKQEESMRRFEEMKGEEIQYSLQACEDRQEGIPPKLKEIEPHSHFELKRAIFREELCMNILKSMQLKLIGICFSPPLLLLVHLVEDINEDIEREEQMEIEQKVGHLGRE